MASPSRFTSGVTNALPNDTLKQYGLPDPASWHSYFDDFDTYLASQWVVTETGVATQALADADGGTLLITNAAADNDASFSQKVGESFLMEVGKRAIFKARFQVSGATESDFVMGLQITDTSPLAVTDGIYFQKDDGDTDLDFHVTKNSTSTSATAIATVVDATYLTVGFYYDGKVGVEYFVDDVHIGTSVLDNLPDDEELTISFGIQNGEAVAKLMTIDYIFAAKER